MRDSKRSAFNLPVTGDRSIDQISRSVAEVHRRASTDYVVVGPVPLQAGVPQSIQHKLGRDAVGFRIRYDKGSIGYVAIARSDHPVGITDATHITVESVYDCTAYFEVF